jgi:hypothetical protein
MLRKLTIDVVAAALLAGAAAANDMPARDPALKEIGTFDLILRTREARLGGQTEAWFRFCGELLARAPEHHDFLFSCARAAAASGERKTALRLLALGLERGAGYGVAETPEFASMKGDPAFQRLLERDALNSRPLARATRFASIDVPEFQSEGIAYDPNGARFLLGSGKGEIWQVDAKGVFTPFVQPKDGSLHPVLGMKVDAKRNLLWAVNTIFPNFPPVPNPKPGTGLSAVNVYDLGTGALQARYVLDERPVVHGFNDLVLLANGDAFVSDSAMRAIYKIDVARGAVSRFFADDDITFPNGIALSPDERLLYVAHVEGVSAIEIATGRRTQLSIARDMTVASIDGLIAVGRSLYGVQPSPYLQRSVRLDLDESGLKVERLTVLNARSHPTLQAATCVIADGALYTTGNPDAGNANAAPGQPREPTTILRIPL